MGIRLATAGLSLTKPTSVTLKGLIYALAGGSGDVERLAKRAVPFDHHGREFYLLSSPWI